MGQLHVRRILIFKLDPKTGLRDTATKYDYKENETDPYMGYKLAGGVSRSGEASSVIILITPPIASLP